MTAIAFANADPDTAHELVVIFATYIHHDQVIGAFYDVRIFDDVDAGRPVTRQLPISEHFGVECECDRGFGDRNVARFKSVADVEAELRRLGF